MSKLSGKIVLITGGNSGIGLAAARRFVQEGAGGSVKSKQKISIAAVS
jgi:NAD(P)-dependent dehydrogenase (short-subunit alcohol dehydrogenase family)